MFTVSNILIILATAVFMEFVAWATHKYVMHGFLWYLHKDHHEKEPGFFEKNDAFFLIFAIPSWLFIQFGLMYKIYWLASIGYGIALYGILYFLIHDVIIHQRFKWFSRSNNVYVKTIRWAHKMHHKSLKKQDGESFGMLIVAKKYFDKVNKDKNFVINKVAYNPNDEKQ
jgi:beta-carotene 3-hydroxylase